MLSFQKKFPCTCEQISTLEKCLAYLRLATNPRLFAYKKVSITKKINLYVLSWGSALLEIFLFSGGNLYFKRKYCIGILLKSPWMQNCGIGLFYFGLGLRLCHEDSYVLFRGFMWDFVSWMNRDRLYPRFKPAPHRSIRDFGLLSDVGWSPSFPSSSSQFTSYAKWNFCFQLLSGVIPLDHLKLLWNTQKLS